jgi:hypothetical protein
MCDGRTQCMTVLLMHPWPEAEPISQARAPLCRSTKWAHPARRYICKILPATWHATSLSDRWRGHGAGGAPPSWTWGANPQFRLSCAVGASVVIVCAQPDTKNLKQARVADGLAHFLFASHLFYLSAASPRAFPVPCRFPSPQAEQSPFC